MNVLSLFIHPHVVPNVQDLRSSLEHKLRYFFMKSKIFPILNRQQHNYHVQGPEK